MLEFPRDMKVRLFVISNPGVMAYSEATRNLTPVFAVLPPDTISPFFRTEFRTFQHQQTDSSDIINNIPIIMYRLKYVAKNLHTDTALFIAGGI
jgi:hypothetical protein